MTGLPAYITGVPDLSDKAVTGIGTALPPHVSIRGNRFTLVDGAGNKRVLPAISYKNEKGEPETGPGMVVLVADIGDTIGKMFFPDKWNPDSDEPPACWSTNGVGPSREAISPQARTCAECKKNERGSKISETGASVKACRDEILTAIVHPEFPGLLFQFKITPGSFKNWRKHVEECKNIAQGAHVGVVMTRVTFEPDQNGVLLFKAVAYPDEATFGVKMKALAAKSTDALVGRLDRPRELAAPTVAAASLTHQPAAESAQTAGFGQIGAIPVSTPAAGSTSTASPSEPEAQKRKRRTKAEIEADNAAAQAKQGGFGGQAGGAGAAMAPFRPEAPPPATQGNGAAFGINPNPPGPSAEIAASLEQAFGKPAGGGGFGS